MDEPPRSDAGQDVVIQLPTDWAVLDGRDSLDDHGISHYEWTLIRGDTAINMKVSVYFYSANTNSRAIIKTRSEFRKYTGVSMDLGSHGAILS